MMPIAYIHPHITIEEINTLTTDEKDLLLCICNVLAPIQPPMPTDDDKYPASLNIIRYTHREAVLDRIKQTEVVIKDDKKELYNGLRGKFGISLIIVEPPKIEESKPLTEESKK